MGAVGTLGWVSRAGSSEPQSKVIRQPRSQLPSQAPEATHREIFKWCQVHCLCGRKKKTRHECKEDGANSCLWHPVWLSQQCSKASLASERIAGICRYAGISLHRLARAATRTRGNGLQFKPLVLVSFSSPLHPASCSRL